MSIFVKLFLFIGLLSHSIIANRNTATKSFSAGIDIIEKNDNLFKDIVNNKTSTTNLFSFTTLTDVELCERKGYFFIKNDHLRQINKDIRYKIFLANLLLATMLTMIFILVIVQLYLLRNLDSEFYPLSLYNSYIKYNVAFSRHSLDSLGHY